MKFLYLKGIEIFGPLETEQLTKEEVFSADLLVCPEDKAEQEAAWKPASHYEDFKTFLEKGNAPIKEESEEKDRQSLPDDSVNSENENKQDKNLSQDLPLLEDTETETDTTGIDEFSFQQIMDDMVDKREEEQHNEEEDIQDHTFHIANKEDNLLEDLPAHSLLGSEEKEDSLPDANKNIDLEQNSQITDGSLKNTNNVQGDRDLLEISNNKIISSSDGRVKKQKPNDLLFILSFLVLIVVAIALCMAFWNIMSNDKSTSQAEVVQNENILSSDETEQNTLFVPEVSNEQQKEGEIKEEVSKTEAIPVEEQVIDIVKNTKIKNKGTIGDYLNRVYGGEYKTSWSAKLFTDKVYIVEFFASQVRSEPYVYLFRVDIDQKKITGALNNITLDLLA